MAEVHPTCNCHACTWARLSQFERIKFEHMVRNASAGDFIAVWVPEDEARHQERLSRKEAAAP